MDINIRKRAFGTLEMAIKLKKNEEKMTKCAISHATIYNKTE